MNELLSNQQVLDIAKKTLHIVVKQLAASESSSFNEQSIEKWLEKWSEDGSLKVNFTGDDISSVIKHLFDLSGKVKFLDIDCDGIKLKGCLGENIQEVISQEINVAFDIYLKGLNLFNSFYNILGDEEKTIDPLDKCKDLPEGWIPNNHDQNELETNEELNYWKSEIVEMHDRIRRRAAGEKV